jgi:hypothetical protein
MLDKNNYLCYNIIIKRGNPKEKEIKTMTVKELKEILEKYNDDAKVELWSCTDCYIKIEEDIIFEECD